jgi:hypothetical protein
MEHFDVQDAVMLSNVIGWYRNVLNVLNKIVLAAHFDGTGVMNYYLINQRCVHVHIVFIVINKFSNINNDGTVFDSWSNHQK